MRADKDIQADGGPVMRPEAETAQSMRDFPSRGDRATILIVDDEGTLRALLAELLEGAGYHVLLAENGETALSLAEHERPALVLTDCSMPRLDGPELIHRLSTQPRTRHIPVVAMSAMRPPVRLPASVPFIEKPFDIEEVLEVVALYTSEPRGYGDVVVGAAT